MNRSPARRSVRAGKAALVSLLLASSSGGCSRGPVLRGRIAGLETTVQRAESRGAMRCAPRELALAKSHLRFATTSLDQGESFAAERHIGVAEPNVVAALDRTGDGTCGVARAVVAEDGPLPRPARTLAHPTPTSLSAVPATRASTASP